jgi:hypothetical protein
MKCLHCRQENFAWARTCDHCGAAIPQTALSSAPDVSSTTAPDLATIRAVMPLRYCNCLKQDGQSAWTGTKFHPEVQDTQSEGWKRLLELVEMAAADDREEFAPFHERTLEAQSQVITLPSTIGKLKSVGRLLLYGSFLVRIPPEIGDMENLVAFKPYTSYRLHWFPYEITRCAKLDESAVSTRALYGNYKYRPPFPHLETPLSSAAGVDLENLPPERYGAPAITRCSVCRTLLAQAGLHQVWVSLKVGTDVLPLLVNACSLDCVERLPPAPRSYLSGPHTGGLSAERPRYSG